MKKVLIITMGCSIVISAIRSLIFGELNFGAEVMFPAAAVIGWLVYKDMEASND